MFGGVMFGEYSEKALAAEEMSKSDVDISKLLEKPGIDAQFLLFEASKQNSLTQMEELVSKWDADVNKVIEVTSPFGKFGRETHKATPLFAAVDGSALHAVEWLLSSNADPNAEIKFPGDDNTTTPIWSAAEKGNIRIAKLLLDHGADVNRAKTCNGNTPLFVAVQNEHSLMVSLLLSNGADPNKFRKPKPFGTLSPLEMAVARGNPKLVAQLIHGGAEIGDALLMFAKIQHSKESPIIRSAKQKKRKISDVELLQIKDLLDVKPSLRDHPSYTKAQSAEKKGKYREALSLLRGLHEIKPCAQTKLDIDRVIEAIYGVRGSDLTTSVWTSVPLMTQTEPTHFQHYAWAQMGRDIYRHGGCDMSEIFQENKEELWVLNIDTRIWKLVNTGKSPGPRSGHALFAWKDHLYLWGGNSTVGYDSKLYRLDVKSGARVLNWETVKTSSLKPDGREDHAGYVYRGKYYISGGMIHDKLSDELWSLDLTSFKWKWLKNSPVDRHCHGMWAANNKIFVVGGRRMHEAGVCNNFHRSYSIEAFMSFDLEKKVWKSEDVIGDRPFDLSEMTVLPVYGESNDDPTSIIIWGGYTEFNMVNGLDPHKSKEMKAHYGDEYEDYQNSLYRNRLLRYYADTNVWKKLEPTSAVLPKAQSFAAVINHENGSLKLLIGGGYGFTGDSEVVNFSDSELSDYDDVQFPLPKTQLQTPKSSNKVYEVVTGDFGEANFATKIVCGDHWSWEFFCLQGNIKIGFGLRFPQFDPTLHNFIDVSFEDFSKPPCESIVANDDDTLLGVRAQLNGLVGRSDLNGQIARIGKWIEQKERYQVFLPCYERGGPASLLVKPTNLLIAKPLNENGVQELLKKGAMDVPKKFPYVSMTLLVKKNGGKAVRPFLEQIIDPQQVQDGTSSTVTDTYRGPVSRSAQSILRTVCLPDSMFMPMLGCIFSADDHFGSSPTKAQIQQKNQQSIYVDFVRKLREKDSVRVKTFEKELNKITEKEVIEKCGKWLKIRVEVDGFKPITIHRELLVSPNVPMQRFHSQILCPALGWSPYHHCYAFRRTGCPSEKMNFDCPSEEAKEIEYASMMMDNECWIGPKVSTALDAMFMPLYIGGCVANDKHITLGQLFTLERNGGNPSVCYLQYVHDYGDWWTHNIRIEKYRGSDTLVVPKEATVAHLIGGQGGSIPEDIGIAGYLKRMNQLTGKMMYEEDDDDTGGSFVDPGGELWWKMFNSDFRSKPNRSNFSAKPNFFDLRMIRSKMEIELRRPKQKAGLESTHARNFNRLNGLTLEDEKCTVSTHKNQTEVCAVCGVTVALKLCSACSAVAYCSKEHQKKDRPNHKKFCKQVQERRRVKTN